MKISNKMITFSSLERSSQMGMAAPSQRPLKENNTSSKRPQRNIIFNNNNNNDNNNNDDDDDDDEFSSRLNATLCQSNQEPKRDGGKRVRAPGGKS